MAEREPSYFVKEFGWREGLAAYESVFAGSDDALAVGEKSARYADAAIYRGVPRRIARLLPDARLIYLLRHPIDRMVSQYYMEGVRGGESRPIDSCLTESEYFSGSLYSFQIEQYLRYFDRERLLLVTTEELREGPANTLRRVFEFVGVAPEWEVPDPDLAVNRRGDVRGFAVRRKPGEVDPSTQVLSAAARERLIERLQPDLERLPGHFGHPFECWALLR